jgi:hypothetical protein
MQQYYVVVGMKYVEVGGCARLIFDPKQALFEG